MKVQLSDELLLSIQKPARYIGGEVNSIYKEPGFYDVHYCFCFPDVYDVGMCHLGLQILYHELNKPDHVYCERAFAPWPDMEEKMREQQIPLYSLETFTPLKEFDFLGFTLQYEMSYTNILNMLDLAGIPLFASERGEEAPLVMAGGPNAYNPEPLADFIDLFYLGEGEVEYAHLFELYAEHRKNGGSKRDFLKLAAQVPGIYVPSFYEVSYDETAAEGCEHTGCITSFRPKYDFAPEKVRKVLVEEMDTVEYPTKPIVPYIQIVHDRAAMEIFRGCLHGCRFCQAGMIYRPVRRHSRQAILAWVDEVLKNTGYDEISLTSLSSNDYPELYSIIREIHEKYPHIHISLPSLRVDAFSLALMDELAQGKKSGLTFAAEAGTQRLRDVINKGITEEEILSGVGLAFRGGFDKVKLYFMLGLPTETYEDIEGIAQLSKKIVWTWNALPKEERSADVRVTSSTSFFVPKPFTPFQWCAQDSYEHFMEKQAFLTEKIRHKKIQYDCHDAFLSTLEGLLARGDRRTGKLIYAAWKNGCRFDSWSDLFSEAAWKKAIEESGTELAYYNYRVRSREEILPWDHIDVGVTKRFLLREYDKAYEAKTTAPCNQACSGCGMKNLSCGGICYETKEGAE